MARDSQGNYSLPAGTLVNSGQTILPSQHNPAMNDIAAALTQSLARSGVGGMLADLNLNTNDILNAGNVEAQGTVTAQGDGTFNNLNITNGNEARFGSLTFKAKIVAGRPTLYFDSDNNHYIQWAPDLNRIRVALFGAVVLNILPGTAGLIGLGPYVQGSPT